MWAEGMSLLAFAHRFADANKLTGPEFYRLFRIAPSDPVKRAAELIRPDASALSLEALLDALTEGAQSSKQLFALTHSITEIPQEVSTNLRFCRDCLAIGHHFAWQQLVWLDACPIHHRVLRNACDCGKSIRYRLNQRNLTHRVLCDCGLLRFGKHTKLSNQNAYALNNFYLRIRQVRELFGPGFYFLRLRYDPPSAEELQAAFRLTQNALRATVEPDGAKVQAVALRELEYHDQISDHQNWLRAEFEDYFNNPSYSGHRRQETTSQSVARLQSAWADGDVLDELKNWLCAGPARPIPRPLRQFVEILFVYRALEVLRRGTVTLDRYRGEIAYRVSQCVSNPVCLVTAPASGSRATPRVLWLRNNDYRECSKVSWIDSLSRFLVVARYGRSKSATVARRLLGSLGLPSGPDGGPQLDLFNNQAAGLGH